MESCSRREITLVSIFRTQGVRLLELPTTHQPRSQCTRSVLDQLRTAQYSIRASAVTRRLLLNKVPYQNEFNVRYHTRYEYDMLYTCTFWMTPWYRYQVGSMEYIVALYYTNYN